MSDEGKIPLGEIVDTIEARVRSLQRYPANMKPETVGRICNHLTAGADVLRFVETHADGLRHLVEFLRDQRTRGVTVATPTDDEAARLMSHPAVREVVAAFPDVGIGHVRTISGDQYLTPEGAAPLDE